MPGHEIISHMATVKECIEVHNATFIIAIDSGSGITVMSSQVIAHIPSISSKGLVTCPSMTVRSVTGQDLKVIGKINTNLEICGHTINFTVYVAEDFHFDCLLGTDILSALELLLTLPSKRYHLGRKVHHFQLLHLRLHA